MVGRPKAEVRDRGRDHDCFLIETLAIVQQVEGSHEEEHFPTAKEPQVRSMVGCVWGGRNDSNPKAPAGVEGEARLVRRGKQGRGRVSRIVGVGEGAGEQVPRRLLTRMMLGLPPRMSYFHQKR